MNDQTELLIIVGAFVLISIVELVLHYLDRSQYAGIMEQISGALFVTLDAKLATVPGLQPVNVFASFVESLIDEDTDALSALLPPTLRAKLRAKLDQIEALTDGQPPAPELKITAGWVSSGVAQAIAEEATKPLDQAVS